METKRYSKVQRQSVLINFTAFPTNTQSINKVNFVPDEVEIKYISAIGDTLEATSMKYIYSSLINDYIGTVVNGQTTQVGTVFPLGKPIAGDYIFETRDFLGDKMSITGDVSIMLEFRKYL